MKYPFSRSTLLASTLAAVWTVLGAEGASYGQTPSAGNKIYWTEERDLGWLRRSDLNGANVESLVTTDIAAELQMGRPWAVAPDFISGDRSHWLEWGSDYSAGDRIYWTEWAEESGKGAIRRAGRDGLDVETLVTGLQVPFDLAFDPFEHKMYWTDRQAGTIQRADLDGAGLETLVTGLEAPADIALDIVWDHVEDPCPTCAGKAAKPAEHIPHDVGAPTRIFWTDGRAGIIQRSDLDGSNVEVLVRGIGGPAGLAVSRAYFIAWGERDTGTLRTSDLDGSNIRIDVRFNELDLVGFTEDLAFLRSWNAESKTGFIDYLLGYGPLLSIKTAGAGGLATYGFFSTGLYWTDTTGIHHHRGTGLPNGSTSDGRAPRVSPWTSTGAGCTGWTRGGMPSAGPTWKAPMSRT